MTHLSLTGVSADGKRLLLVSDRGAEHTLDITPALRAALRGETTRLGQLEIKMSSSLRPREIQDRIRSGENPEAVATAAGTTVEAIMPFVAPVLAEREHVAARAQRSSVRRPAAAGGSTPTRALEDAVAAHLRSQDTKPDTVSWDAARRDDGKWTLTATYDAPRRSGTGHFTYDAPGNYVTADDDDARWLLGDLHAEPVPAPQDDLEQVRQRRLAAVPGDELPLGEDTLDLLDVVDDRAAEPPVTAEPSPAPAEPAAEVADEAADEDDRSRHRRPVQKRRGRASVPSWDEIMFGSSD